MKFSFLFFALFITSLSTFAADIPNSLAVDEVMSNDVEAIADVLDKEICYTTTLSGSLSVPVIGAVEVSAGVEITGCGETADAALDALVEGIARIIRLIRP